MGYKFGSFMVLLSGGSQIFQQHIPTHFFLEYPTSLSAMQVMVFLFLFFF